MFRVVSCDQASVQLGKISSNSTCTELVRNDSAGKKYTSTSIIANITNLL